MELSDYYSTKDHFIVEDLFDFSSNDAPGLDAADDNAAFDDSVNGSSTDLPSVAGGNGCGSSVSRFGPHLSADFIQPCEEVEELEWLSNFMEDCFSNKDYHQKPIQFSNMNLNSSSDQITTQHSGQLTNSNANASTVPAKTRSKRSRANPSNWASRLPILSQIPTPTPSSDSGEKPWNVPMMTANANSEEGVRRCLHCGSDKTPQWRMGPMGPKTLCNACGVRYKSGRLVPEYRPAASPTFVVSQHSNSHRKVVELRRQKEMRQQQQVLFWS